MLNIFKKHLKKYPVMSVEDFIKLIFQAERGIGHLLLDREKSLEYLKEEIKISDNKNSYIEDIGEKYDRLYLSNKSSLKGETINNILFLSNKLSGDTNNISLENPINKLLDFLKSENKYYSEVENFICEYISLKYPIISHSDLYRESYKPHYRVISKRYGKIIDVLEKIDSLLLKKERIIVLIEGRAGSGKTTLAKIINEVYKESTIIKMDDFFLQPHQRTEERLSEVGGNVDYERFSKEVSENLFKKSFYYKPFNCTTLDFDNKIIISQNSKIIIIEGSYSSNEKMNIPYDLMLFVNVEKNKQINRIKKRNGSIMLERFINEWIPKEEEYFNTFNIIKNADIKKVLD